MKHYTTDDITVTRSTRINIVTSGYSDRFIMQDATYRAEIYTDGGQSVSCSFDDRQKMISFLTNLIGLSFDDAYALIPEQSEYWISGKTDRRTHSSRKLTRQQAGMIETYLKVHHGSGLKPEYMEQYQKLLAENPLDPDVLAIVQWQITECDRKNVETWGHKNGHWAAVEAGLVEA